MSDPTLKPSIEQPLQTYQCRLQPVDPLTTAPTPVLDATIEAIKILLPVIIYTSLPDPVLSSDFFPKCIGPGFSNPIGPDFFPYALVLTYLKFIWSILSQFLCFFYLFI